MTEAAPPYHAGNLHPPSGQDGQDSQRGRSTQNDQVLDAIDQIQQSLTGLAQPVAAAAAFNMVTHALGLALHNAVARQQHSHMLRSALTTAAAAALLDGRTEQAQAVLQLAESPLVNPTFEAEVGQLQQAVTNLRVELEKVLAAAGSVAAATAAPAAA